MPPPHVVANRLRMARKSFTEATWRAWVAACRRRHAGDLSDHPEGLWARAWELFQADRPSVEAERSRRLSRRQRDEFWYAERFGLAWPAFGSKAPPLSPADPAFAPALLAEAEPSAEPSPSPSPPPCKLSGITPNAPVVCVGSPVRFTAQGEHLEHVTWSAQNIEEGSEIGPSITTSWDLPGRATVSARCGKPKAFSDVTVVRLTFDEPVIRTRFTKGAEPIKIVKESFLTCDPPYVASKIILGTDCLNRADVKITNADDETGKIAFTVKGTSGTSAKERGGDMRIQAKIGTKACQEAAVIVVVPTRISDDPEVQPDVDGDVEPKNIRIDRDTSPAFPTKPGTVGLVTIWRHLLTMHVLDQPGAPLDPAYAGVQVEEILNGKWVNINQPMAGGGTYSDPVGVYTPEKPAPVPATDTDRITKWETTDPTLQMPKVIDSRQIIPVRVGGHLVEDVKRTAVATPANNVSVQWDHNN